MKKILTKIVAFLAALAMGFGTSALTAFAQEQPAKTTSTDNASITVNNAANGETYKVYKLFDATYNTTTDAVAYTGTVPESLKAYFTQDATTGAITITDAGKDANDATQLNATAVNAIKAYAATLTDNDAVAIAISDGSSLKFTGLSYGYYIVTSSQNNGAAIGVDSTKPDATINDKNTTMPIENLTKTDNKEGNVSIGDTVTYTVKFKTANYVGTKQITSYTLTDSTDTNFLENVNVTSITIGGKAYTVEGNVPQFDNNKQITIPWATNGKSNYANGAEVVVTYTAKVAQTAAIAGNGNTNTIKVEYATTDGTTNQETASDKVSTYALAIKKVSDKGTALSGATFSLPFDVVKNDDGTYTHVANGTAGAVNSVTTPTDGVIVIKGVAAGTYTITETKAPDGYNKLAEPITAIATKTSEKTTNVTKYIDDNGNIVDTKTDTSVTYQNNNIAADAIIVVNKTGSTLPSTGGIGTTVFYVGGIAIVAIAAGLLLARRKRA